MFINIFKLFTKLTLIIAAVLFLSLSNYENETPAGNSVKDFNLMNVDGKTVSLSDYPDAKGFIKGK